MSDRAHGKQHAKMLDLQRQVDYANRLLEYMMREKLRLAEQLADTEKEMGFDFSDVDHPRVTVLEKRLRAAIAQRSRAFKQGWTAALEAIRAGQVLEELDAQYEKTQEFGGGGGAL